MKKMKSFTFSYKNDKGENQYDHIVATNFNEALHTLYGNVIPDIDYVSSSEVNVVI